MGKRKKPKTQHLGDAEIWDDSALIHSWDEAMAEYELYQSIHARGEDVEEVLRKAELEEALAEANALAAANGERVSPPKNAGGDEDFEEGEVEDDEGDDSVASADDSVNLKHEPQELAEEPQANSIADGTLNDASQQHPAATTANQTLENIKMAYWWAGYYSGLYEGQQQAAPT